MTTDLYSKPTQGHSLDADSPAAADTARSFSVRAPETVVTRNNFALSADTFVGTSGNDTFQVDDAADVVIEAANGGTDRIYASVGYTLPDNVEILELDAGAQSLKGVGNTLNNLIEAGAGNDTLDGGIGADTMWGGAGNDSYFVDNANDVVQEISTNAGVDTVYASVSYQLDWDAAVEKIVLTGTASIDATGSRDNNYIVGNSGANVLTGGDGADTLEGGAGNDTYVDILEGTVLVEKAGGGTDTVVVEAFEYVLAQNFENLTISGIGARGTGNAVANLITGDVNDNVLDGAGGADTLAGGNGNDWYYVDQSGDTIVELVGNGTDQVFSSIDWTLSANTDSLTLTGALSINGTGNVLDNQLVGNDADNELRGGAGADTLLGGQGNDVLNGGLGADSMEGGLGDDTYYVDDANDSVFDYDGTDTVRSSVSYQLDVLNEDVENLTLIGNAAINGYGNGGLNHIVGNSANNVLDDGGHVAGVDTLQGGLGNDRYILRGGGVTSVILEGVNGGTDTVVSSGSATLAANVENLELDDDDNDVLGRGNDLANKITVLSEGFGNDTLDGGRGADTLIGGRGGDTYVVDNSGDKVVETADGDTDLVQSSVAHTLQDNVENLTLTGTAIYGTGNDLANVLIGNAAVNMLNGGTGIDTLIGGAGNDTYVLDNTQDKTVEVAGGGVDTVRSSVAHTLQDNVENLTLIGTAAYGTGNSLVNTLVGNASANTLDGKSGSDKLTGGAGADIFALSSMLGSDLITDFAHGVDKLRLSQAAIRVGDGDTLVENAVSLAGPNGFNTSAELVVVTHDIAGSITAASAATAIGHANSNYAAGDTRLFVVDNGSDSAVYLFKSADANSAVSANELTLLTTLDNTASTNVSDYVFGV